jgi:hypothetical protein
MKDKTNHDPHGEGAAAKTEAVNIVAGLIVHTKEFIDVENIALKTPTERAAQYGQRLKRGGADAIVVKGNLTVTAKVHSNTRQTLDFQTVFAAFPVPSESRMMLLDAGMECLQTRSCKWLGGTQPPSEKKGDTETMLGCMVDRLKRPRQMVLVLINMRVGGLSRMKAAQSNRERPRCFRSFWL